MSGLTPEEIDRKWEESPLDLKKSFYEETPGIAILSSFQLFNTFPILSFTAWLFNYDNNEHVNVAVIIFGAVLFLYNIYRYKVMVSFVELHNKWRHKPVNQRLSITKTYALISIVTFFLTVWIVN